MRRRVSPFIQDLFNPANIGPFLVGAIALGIGSESVFHLLSEALWDHWLANVVILAGVIVLVVIVVLWLRWRFERSAQRESFAAVRSEDLAEPHRALIAVAGVTEGSNKPLEAAIAHHRPALEHCWLLTTKLATAEADRLEAKYEDEGLTVTIARIDKAEDARATLVLVERIIDRLAQVEADPPLVPADVIVDITGGLKPITAGAVMACFANGVALQYTRSERDRNGDPVRDGKLEAIRMVYDIDLLSSGGKS